MKILITGAAGFIGSNLCESLSQDKNLDLIGIDSLNTFYDPKIKKQNIESLITKKKITFFEGSLLNTKLLKNIFSKHNIDAIIHLAAYAGVRPSIKNPKLYYDHNIIGTSNLLEHCKESQIKRVLFASSSSVYGNNKKVPFSENDPVDHPISPYAASKKAGELLCYNYHHLYQIEIACIRFFTVYGPRQRPEMAIHKFTDLINHNKEIPVYNEGNCLRDYTYIDDITHGIIKILHHPTLRYDIINLGESKTISTLELINLIEKELGKKAKLKLLPSQAGDVEKTFADISHAQKTYNYRPNYSIEKGIKHFVSWYKTLHKL